MKSWHEGPSKLFIETDRFEVGAGVRVGREESKLEKTHEQGQNKSWQFEQSKAGVVENISFPTLPAADPACTGFIPLPHLSHSWSAPG